MIYRLMRLNADGKWSLLTPKSLSRSYSLRASEHLLVLSQKLNDIVPVIVAKRTCVSAERLSQSRVICRTRISKPSFLQELIDIPPHVS